MDQCDHLLIAAVTGRHRLRIEKLRIDEVDMLRRSVQRRGDELFRRQDVVQLSERVYAFNLRFIIWKRKRPYLLFLQTVFHGLGEKEFVLNHRAANVKFRRVIAESSYMSAANPEIRSRLLQGEVPFFATPLGFDCDHSCRKSSVLRQKRSLQNTNGIDTTHGHGTAETSCSRFGHVAGIDKKRAS